MAEENIQDLGKNPEIINIRQKTLCNENFRTAIWTGDHLQITVMSIPVGGEIGLEMHPDVEQVIKIESGCASVYMGKCKQDVKFVGKVNANYLVVIPAGTWHNIINTCSCPLKLFSVYAPKNHPFGTVHKTKLDADLQGD